MSEAPTPRGTPAAARANWRRSELPFGRKLGVALRNSWAKVRTRKGCCGNYGDPGC